MKFSRFLPVLTAFFLFAVLAILVTSFVCVVCAGRAHGAEAKLYTVPVADSSRIIEIAQQHAVAHKEPLFILVGASWCGPCHAVERLYVPTLRARGTYLHLDRDLHGEWIRKLGVVVKALPTLIVIEGAKRWIVVGTDQIRLLIEGK